MTIKGPEKNALIQKKERILGFWFNTKKITYNQLKDRVSKLELIIWSMKTYEEAEK